MFMDRLAEAINIMKTHERMGRAECVVNSTKFLKSILATLKKESYINDFEPFMDGKILKIRIKLSNRINAIGVVKPRYAVQKDTIQKYETRYIPSKDFGILVLSTPQGLMTNREAREKSIGGRLVLYVY
jgi:small subunit ribosomal protein S8